MALAKRFDTTSPLTPLISGEHSQPGDSSTVCFYCTASRTNEEIQRVQASFISGNGLHCDEKPNLAPSRYGSVTAEAVDEPIDTGDPTLVSVPAFVSTAASDMEVGECRKRYTPL